MTLDLKDKLIDIQNDLPVRQRAICKFIIENIDEVSTMTITELAEKSGVGTTTIVRFIEKIGYKRFPEFKNDVIKYNFNNKKNTWWHLKKSLEEMDGDQNSLAKVGKGSVESIEAMVGRADVGAYEKFLDILLNANKVYFLGMRTSKSLALYFEMMLRGILDDVHQLSLQTDFMYDESLKFKKEDALIVFALSPYAKQTIEFVKYCRKHTDISIVLITDLETCPIIRDIDAHLIAGPNKDRYSIIPTVTLIESLIIDLGKNKLNSVEAISKLNEIHRDNEITTL